MKYEAQCGDIFLCDSNRTGAKIVKFFMQSPTIWHQIWRWIRGTLEPVRFYHAGMILDDTQMIEQQWKVKYSQTQKILSRKIVIYRYKPKSDSFSERNFQIIVKQKALEDIGHTYDIPQLIGKFLTWLTGIKFFVRFLGEITVFKDICVTAVGDWFWYFCHFGVKTHSELTTKIVDEYCQKHPEEWEVVYYNNKEN